MNLVPAITLIVIAAIAGYVIGIVDSRITATMRKKNEDTEAASTEMPASEGNLPGEHTVLKVTVDAGLKWHVELDNKRPEDPGSISAEQRKRLVSTVVQMRPWMDAKPEAETTDAVTIQNIPTRASGTEMVEPGIIPQGIHPSPVTTIPLSPISAPAAQGSGPVNTAPPKIDAMRGLRSLLKGEIKSPSSMKGVSIVAMIDDVLQARLLMMPQITKSVRLEEGGLGEVIVVVGSTSYQGVDSVPDADIRSVIKDAIADWNNKH